MKNCNPHSRLHAFPYLAYDAAVEEALGHLGDTRNERTTGMYRKRDEKLAEIGLGPDGKPLAALEPVEAGVGEPMAPQTGK